MELNTHCRSGTTELKISDFLQKQIAELSNTMEERYDGRWQVSDAPANYVENLKKALIGIEIEITKIEGPFNLSQESGNGDWTGNVKGYSGLGTPEGDAMAQMIQEKGRDRPSLTLKLQHRLARRAGCGSSTSTVGSLS
ncbi:hypothetical protein I316_01279 [Kwoniella heveanensis BCC8398]|uniref:Uncharacterized protein n=1 Tax=Kwoniella heveanensis BCC8398 TaxID=1296120 RepID=A0A1B9H079_9TREE|nr:hypothetical protein I316_01279 [Kwoniella heveanensis BCC8398]